MKIMLVDDSRTMRAIQRKVLAQLGHTDIEEAADGREALDKIASYRPDLILVDWNMPEMDGLEFVTRLRRTDKTTPLLMVTTQTEKAWVIEAIKAGVNDYLVKPFTPDVLAQQITQVFDRARARV